MASDLPSQIEVLPGYTLSDLVGRVIALTSEFISLDGQNVTFKIYGSEQVYIGALDEDIQWTDFTCKFHEVLGVVISGNCVRVLACAPLSDDRTHTPGGFVRYAFMKGVELGRGAHSDFKVESPTGSDSESTRHSEGGL